MIRMENICFAYEGAVALRYVNLTVEEGECVCIQGTNGCGKTTLLKLMCGLLFAEEGRYFFEGEEVTEKKMKQPVFAKSFHQKSGYVFQNPDVQLFCSDVEEELAFGPVQMGLSSEEITRRTEDVMELLGIGHLRNRAPYTLSGGEKKKAAIGCVLTMNPDVLILDEPLAGLDSRSQKQVTDILLSLKAAGKTIIFSTHNDAFAKLLADRFIFMNDDHEINKEIE